MAVLMMFRLRLSALPWVLWRLARGAAGLGRVPGLRFARVLGSGYRGGFGLKPGLDCQGVFACFDSLEQALDFVRHSPLAHAYRARAVEHFSAVLQATTSRGSWGGHRLESGATGPHEGPVVALTRAAIRPSKVLQFWRHSPPAEVEIARAPGCRLAVGLGEAPLVRQATFSVWDSVEAMDAYARHGSHQRAIQASWQQGFFSEWMFVRFRPVALNGAWRGQPLQELAGAA